MSKATDFQKRVLFSEEAYRKGKKSYITQIEQNNKDAIKEVINEVSKIFKDRKHSDPFIMLNALRLIKDTMDTKNVDLVTGVQINILPFLNEFAKFKYKLKDDDRGAFFFSEQPDENLKVIGNSFFRLLLECILFWSKWFPKDLKNNDTKFKQSYDSLIKLGVKFPEQINYFKPKRGKNPEKNEVLPDLKKEEKKIDESLAEIFQNLSSQKEFLKNLIMEESEDFFDHETFKLLMQEIIKFNKDSPKIMEEIINSDSPKQEEHLSKMLTEQDLVNNIIAIYNGYNSKTLKFFQLRQKIIHLLENSDKYQTPGSIIKEVPEEMENMHSSSKAHLASQQKLSNSNLKATNLDIAMQKNKISSSQNNLSFEEKIEKVPSSQRLNVNQKNNENNSEIKESLSSFKEKLNESNPFMKEAEEQFEKPISMSEFKKIDLGSPEKKMEGSNRSQQNKRFERQESLKEKPEIPKSGIHNQRKNSESKEEMIKMVKDLEILKEETLQKSEKIKSLEFEISKKNDEIIHYKQALDDLNRKFKQNNQEKEELREKIRETDRSSHEKFASFVKEINELKNIIQTQTKEMQNLKENSQTAIQITKNISHYKSLETSPNRNLSLNDTKYERLSAYQDKKNKFEKSPTTYNVLKYSNTNIWANSFDNQTIPNLIYPFTKPNEYYNQIEKKHQKGKLYNYKNIYFIDFEELSYESLLRLKRCCLSQKHLLFENGTIQIGVVTSAHTADSETFLRVSIFIGNMKEKMIESLGVNYRFLKDLGVSVKEIAPSIIPPKGQIKQELIVQYKLIPYQILFNKLYYGIGYESYEISFALPITLNKFMKVRFIEKEQFSNEWTQRKGIGLNSELFAADEGLIKNNIYDFKIYFNNLIDLKPWNFNYYEAGIGDYKLGGSFKIGEEKYEKILWLKIVMTPKKQIAFQVICESAIIQEYFINTLIFIFKKTF